MDLKELDELMVPAEARVDVTTLLGKRLGDVTVPQIITASASAPNKATPRRDMHVEELIDGSDNFI